jgi:hypothetical protein
LSNIDAFEEAREQLGLTKLREKLMNDLLKLASYKKGFDMLKGALEKEIGKPINEKKLLDLLPDVTSLEIALLSLLKRVPEYYLQNQCLFSIHNVSVHGIEFVSDEFDDHDDERNQSREQPHDPYTSGGLTGANEDAEIVPFKPKAKKIMEKLILLTISNKRLHENLFRSNDGSLPVCFGLLMRTAYEKVKGSRSDPKSSCVGLAQNLDTDEAKRFYETYDALQKSLASALIHDLALDRTLSEFETFRLVSILERVPAPLLESKPFVGYAVPYGLGVSFIDHEGEHLDYVPYRKLFATDAVHNIYYEKEDITKHNRTASEIFYSLMADLSRKTESAHLHGRIPLSVAEEAWMECFTELGIDLIVHPKRSYESVDDGSGKSMLYTSFGAAASRVLSLTSGKFGAAESRQITRTLRLLPKELLAHVKSIVKEKKSHFLPEALLSGLDKLGSYTPGTKSITMYEDPRNPYRTYGKEEGYVYSETLLHEVGESIWANLSDNEKAAFASITGWEPEGKSGWKRPMDAPVSQHFLTFYSHYANNPGDDFSEHFAIYVMHGEEFRKMTDSSEPLAKKYEFIKKVFTSEQGDSLEYPKLSDLSIREMHGELQKEIKRRSMKEAMEAMEAIEDGIFEHRRKHIASIKLSWEQLEEMENEGETDLEAENNPFFGFLHKKR